MTRFKRRQVMLGMMVWLAWQEAVAEVLTLPQAVRLVLLQNPETALNRALIQQAESELRQADVAGLPRVNLSLSGTRSNDALNAFGLKLGQERIAQADFDPVRLNHPAGINNLNTRVEIHAPVYTGGHLEAQTDVARAQLRAARAGDEAARQQLILETVKAYQGVHLARAWRVLSEQSLAAADEYARVTEQLLAQGMAVKSDRLSAKVRFDDAQLRVEEAKRQEVTALDRLKWLMGRSLSDTVDVGPEAAFELPSGEAELLRAEAVRAHPGVHVLRQQIDVNSAGVSAARAATRPQASLMARHDWNDAALGLGAASYTVAGVLSWNAFDGGAGHAAIDRAQAARQASLARLRQSEEAVAFQVTEARRRALLADERVKVREEAIRDAEEAQRLTRMRYQNGMTTQVDLFAVQTRLDQARTELAQARHERSMARAEVLHALGMLDPDTL